MDSLITDAKRIFSESMRDHSRAALACSFGKDSIVLLHLFKELRLPVVFYREPFFPVKYEYANKIIRDWNLVCYDYAACSVQMADGNGYVEIVRGYQIGEQTILVPVGIDKVESGEFLCGRNDILNRPCGTFSFPWDMVLVGHKECDVDPLRGAIPVALELKRNKNSASVCYPLKNWTDADIWIYIEKNGIPIDHGRYEKVDGVWGEKKDRSTNQDWFPACVKCIDRSEPSIVKCPKTGLLINNQSQLLVWNNEPKDYLRPQAKT